MTGVISQPQSKFESYPIRLSDEDLEFVKEFLEEVYQIFEEFEQVYETEKWEELKQEISESEEVRLIPADAIAVSHLSRCEYQAYMLRKKHIDRYGDGYYKVSDSQFSETNYLNQGWSQKTGTWFDRFLKYKLSQTRFSDFVEFDVVVEEEFQGVLFYSRIDVVLFTPNQKKIGIEIKSRHIHQFDYLQLQFYKLFFDAVIVFSPYLYRYWKKEALDWKLITQNTKKGQRRGDLMFDDDMNIKIHYRDEEAESWIKYFEDYAERIKNPDSPVLLNIDFCEACDYKEKCKVYWLVQQKNIKDGLKLFVRKNKVKFSDFEDFDKTLELLNKISYFF
ncbi:hypothetical protein TEU_03400 [Thermococcus eurythermalis]|uniref:PD-(D/E)XK endonuclease-like domain-containing protein n=1 Tax=Thermococcus eurythermalis TaxID=1505907 RepID=A0A097QSM7_9EURY|nr:PD-(D/E)XK nuclease family protein [Thermococcus eurythermalis]AIU69467.1 hypothetical protein TEU_03400 [Thermococcus eurythermalis]